MHNFCTYIKADKKRVHKTHKMNDVQEYFNNTSTVARIIQTSNTVTTFFTGQTQQHNKQSDKHW